ncbi:unnamed protein product [Mytilus edulis]|uniref:Uncharacterized protein n=1 Tax=Mytilus edulis TaxID=6550 RepID=A0A8S3SC81_MYTED|nr:unnamed protein product [Mytilus edulis]
MNDKLAATCILDFLNEAKDDSSDVIRDYGNKAHLKWRNPHRFGDVGKIGLLVQDQLVAISGSLVKYFSNVVLYALVLEVAIRYRNNFMAQQNGDEDCNKCYRYATYRQYITGLLGSPSVVLRVKELTIFIGERGVLVSATEIICDWTSIVFAPLSSSIKNKGLKTFACEFVFLKSCFL